MDFKTPFSVFLLLIFLTGCGNDRYRPDPTGNRIGSHADIHTEFVYLPENDTMQISVRADTVIVQRALSKGTTLSKSRFILKAADRLPLDSLLFFLERLTPGTYEKRGVLEGTKIRITYRGQTTLCDNCLNDYVLRQSGLNLAKPPRKVAAIKQVVALINRLGEQAPETPREKWKRLEVIADKTHLTDTTMKYRINDLDKKK